MLDGPYFALLESLAQRLRGVEPAVLRQAQCLQIDGHRIDFSLERDRHDRAEDRIVLRCDVTHLSGAASEAVCRLLLRANNLWAGTRGATLALRGDDVVILSESARIGSLGAEQLATLVSGLFRQAERWAVELAAFSLPQPAAGPAHWHMRA